MSDSTSPIPSTRETTRSAWNGSRSSSRSPLPANAIGTPTTETTDSAAPPRASPSRLVITTPGPPTRAANAAAGERDRHADHRDHRQRRAAARVAVQLGHHHAGDADAGVELARALDRVL